jgi:ferredoxin
MSFRVVVDPARCQGHGKCMLDCPDVFDSDDQGFATVADSHIDDSLREQVQKAVEGCPEFAISLI